MHDSAVRRQTRTCDHESSRRLCRHEQDSPPTLTHPVLVVHVRWHSRTSSPWPIRDILVWSGCRCKRSVVCVFTHALQSVRAQPVDHWVLRRRTHCKNVPSVYSCSCVIGRPADTHIGTCRTVAFSDTLHVCVFESDMWAPPRASRWHV
jgi:hypothetical protein